MRFVRPLIVGATVLGAALGATPAQAGGTDAFRASLIIEVRENSREDAFVQLWKLQCNWEGSNPAGQEEFDEHPAPEGACATIANEEIQKLLLPEQGNKFSAEQYHGPEQAYVYGTFVINGKRIELPKENKVKFSRQNSRKNQQWVLMKPVFEPLGAIGDI